MTEQKQPPHKQDDASRLLLLLVGAGLVFVGLMLLAQRWLGPAWAPLRDVWAIIQGLGWGLGLILIGVLVIVISQRKGFKAPPKGARLYRSREHKMVAGVFGGLAEYLSMDVTLLRLVFVGLALVFDLWPAVVAYIVAVIIVPEEPEAGAVAEAPSPAVVAPAPPTPPAPPVPELPIPATPPARVPTPPVAEAPTQPTVAPPAEPPAPPTPPPPPEPAAPAEGAIEAPDADVTHE